MNKAICIVCGKEYPIGRAKLGYNTCLECGSKAAAVETQAKWKRTAPLFNKGGYQYITDGDSLKSLNRKV